MITIQSKMLVEEKVAKRSKYSEGIGAKEAKMSSVKKVIMLALLPKVKETHENLRTLLTAVDLSGIPFTFSCDIKLDLMSASSKPPVPTTASIARVRHRGMARTAET